MKTPFAGVRIALVVIAGATAWATAASAAAQTTSSWPELMPKVNVDDQLLVKDTTGEVAKGRLLEITPNALILTVDGGRREIRADRIVEIKRRHWDDPVWTGLLVGLGVGIPCGIAARSYAENEAGNTGIALVGPMLLGAGIGAGVDALLPARTRIYRIRPTAALSVVPIVAPRARGIRVSFRF
jgi:hypothetical protein